jgi:energy-coupling factor transporter ATP-binding protein EcfA2
VPFKLIVQNQQDVILKGETPKVAFEFQDGQGTCGVEEEKLLQVLSQGEKRALYILNVLFEIQARRESNKQTLLIIDDIADSFDYKNKYAIIEYFNEIAKIPFFRLVFLTHNFDFHRTISSRLQIARSRRLFAKKNQGALAFVEEKYQKNPFTTWKSGLAKKPAFLVASIPFVRNLAEYCHGVTSPHYLMLTSLLHVKADSATLTIGDLEASFKATLLDQANLSLPNPTTSAMQLIYDEAEALAVKADDDVELESKVILSIGIRLKAEEFMIAKINDSKFVNDISSNQTFELYSKFSLMFPGASDQIMVLSQVNLMTPENIHLNSFMYEPILDMSALHLYDLYGKIKALV